MGRPKAFCFFSSDLPLDSVSLSYVEITNLTFPETSTLGKFGSRSPRLLSLSQAAPDDHKDAVHNHVARKNSREARLLCVLPIDLGFGKEEQSEGIDSKASSD